MANQEQLIQEAAQSFCIVPEIYQQAFQQNGTDFPDELVQQIKSQPEQAMQMLQQDENLLKGVVTIYQQYGDQIKQAVAQATQQSGMFKKGGKLDYLVQKMQGGGKDEPILRPRGTAPAYATNIASEFKDDGTNAG